MGQLFKDFYNILNRSKQENIFSFEIEINLKHDIFKGHFPNQPVTPGVVQMEIIKELTEEILDKKIQLKSMPNCKFLAILNPAEINKIIIEIEIKEKDNNSIRISSMFKNDEIIYTKASLIYTIY